MEEDGNAVGLAEGAMKRMTMVTDGSGLVNPNLNVPRPTLASCGFRKLSADAKIDSIY